MSALNSLTTSLLHFASSQLTRQGAKKMLESSKQLESIQRAKLQATLALVAGSASGKQHNVSADMSLEEFQQRIPVTDYDHWHDMIVEQQKSNRPMLTSEGCERYQPTSGSTSKIKWIPYTQAFLNELDGAISPWMSDLYSSFPGIKDRKSVV